MANFGFETEKTKIGQREKKESPPLTHWVQGRGGSTLIIVKENPQIGQTEKNPIICQTEKKGNPKLSLVKKKRENSSIGQKKVDIARRLPSSSSTPWDTSDSR